MSDAKQRWAAAHAAVAAIEAERAELLKPSDARYRAALDELQEIEDEAGEFIAKCETCGTPIFDDDAYEVDVDGGIYACEAHASTWADLLAHPDSFLDPDDNYHTPESAKALVDAHLAAGGALTDTPFLTRPQGSTR